MDIIYEDLINDKEKSDFIIYHLLAVNRYVKTWGYSSVRA